MFDEEHVSGSPVVVQQGHTKQFGSLMEENSAVE
jgi:hypothetical protein